MKWKGRGRNVGLEGEINKGGQKIIYCNTSVFHYILKVVFEVLRGFKDVLLIFVRD